MSYQQRRDEGRAREAGGKLRRFFGRLFGDRELEARGLSREMSGAQQKEEAKLEGRAIGTFEKGAGAVQNRVGELIGDDRMASEGREREKRGETRQDVNR
jgi:uncharacterized protein YjbJ (UPF0337 family)